MGRVDRANASSWTAGSGQVIGIPECTTPSCAEFRALREDEGIAVSASAGTLVQTHGAVVGHHESAGTQVETSATSRALLCLAGYEGDLAIHSAPLIEQHVLVRDLTAVIDTQATQIAVAALGFE